MCTQPKSAEMLARLNCASIVLLRHRSNSGGLYKCKSCDRAFDSFQALGGHRASHNRIRVTEFKSADKARLKAHECRDCRIQFPTGQALGGHMRKHAESNAIKRKRVEDDDEIGILVFPILRESKMSKRAVFEFDLNFPPLLEEGSFLQLACAGH